MDPRGVYFGVASSAAGSLLMLGATLWLAGILSPDEFGRFRVGSSFAVLVIPFLALGVERLISKMIQTKADAGQPIAGALFTVLSSVILGVCILAAGYPLLSRFLFDENVPAEVYFLSLAIIPLAIAYNIANTIWRHVGSSSAAQVHMNFTQRALRAPLLIGMSLIWPTAVSASLAMVLAQAVSLFQARRNLVRFAARLVAPAHQVVAANLPTLLVIGLPVAILASVDRIDVLLVNALMGVDRAGSYDLIFMLSLTAMFPAMALAKTTEPFLHGLASSPAQQQQFRALQTRAFGLSVLGVVAIAIFGPLLQLVIGNAGSDFALASLALSAGLAFSSAHGPVIEYLQINGKARLALIMVAALLPVFLALKYFAATSGSLIGVAALAGLFYFTLRAVLSVYIRITDGVKLASLMVVVLSALGYASVAVYVGWRVAA